MEQTLKSINSIFECNKKIIELLNFQSKNNTTQWTLEGEPWRAAYDVDDNQFFTTDGSWKIYIDPFMILLIKDHIQVMATMTTMTFYNEHVETQELFQKIILSLSEIILWIEL